MPAALHRISNWRTAVSDRTMRLRLSKEEAAMPETLSEREGSSPDAIPREALETSCRGALGEPVRIPVSEDELESLREDMLTPPDEEVLRRRAHLMTYERWTDAESDGA